MFKKEELKKYSYDITIVIVYAVLLAIVYGYMTYVLSKTIIPAICVALLCIVLGYIALVFVIKDKIKKDNTQNVSKNVSTK